MQLHQGHFAFNGVLYFFTEQIVVFQNIPPNIMLYLFNLIPYFTFYVNK